MMEKAGHGVNLLTLISLMTLAMVGFAFVDNTDLFLAGKTAAAMGEDMVAEFLEMLDRWSGDLFVETFLPQVACCRLSNPSAILLTSCGLETIGHTTPWRIYRDN